MSRSHPVLRALGKHFHGMLRRSSALSKYYLLSLGAVLRAVANVPLRENIINNVVSVDWGEIRFPARRVDVTDRVAVKLVPHAGEFDFRGLFDKRLRYEEHVFKLLAPRVPKYDVIVEIGANVGIYSIFFGEMARRFESHTRIYVFEPSRRAFFRLLENLEENQLENVVAFNLAVAGSVGFLPFFEPLGHLTNGSLRKDFANIFSQTVRSTVVPSIGGTELEGLLGDAKTFLLKIDVEGAEVEVLESLRELIVARRPHLLLEVLKPFENVLNGLAFLRQHYRFFVISDKGLEERGAFEADPRFRDYWLAPRDNATMTLE